MTEGPALAVALVLILFGVVLGVFLGFLWMEIRGDEDRWMDEVEDWLNKSDR